MEDIEIIAPDGTIIVFPAGTPDADIERAMQAEYGTGEDAAAIALASTPVGPQLAGGDSAETAIDLTSPDMTPEMALQLQPGMWVVGPEGRPYQLPSAPERGVQRIGDEPLQPGLNLRPQSTTEDIARSIPTGLIQGVTSLAGLPGYVQEGLNFGARQVGEAFGLDPERLRQAQERSTQVFTPGELDRIVQGQIGEYYQPQTVPGEYARTIGEFASGALIPGGVAARATSVLAPALASETSGQLARQLDASNPEGFQLEPWARLAGGLAGGGAAAITTQPGGATRGLVQAAENVTPEQLTLAQQLMARSPVPLTTAEAVQQVTGGASGMGRLQQVVEGTQAGRSVLGPMMAERPQAVQSAIGNVLDQIAPAPTNPSAIGPEAQRSATTIADMLRRRINESANDLYGALPGQALSPDDYAQLAGNPSYQAALGTVRNNPELAPLIQGADEDLSTINEVVKQLDTMAEQAAPSPMNPQGNRTLASQRSQARQLADQLASAASPEWRRARETVATGRQAFLEPVVAGPLGRIGQTDDVAAQIGALYPRQALEGGARETGEALRLMGEVSPTVGAQLTRQSLAAGAERANRLLQGGANQWSGAKFAVDVAGGPQQRQTLLTGLREVAPEAVPDVDVLLESLMATGRRPPAGSQTAFNDIELAALSEGGGAQRAAMSANPSTWPGAIRQAMRERTLQNNAEMLAEMLLEGTDAIRRARGLMTPGARRARTGIGLLGYNEGE